MLTLLVKILSDFAVLPNPVLPAMARYLLALMLTDSRHEARMAAKITGCHESQFSRLLNRPDAMKIAKISLNRAARRRLAVLDKLIAHGKQPLLIVDATLIGRRGKKIQNCGRYNHGKGHVRGHKFTNFLLLLDDVAIPLGTLAHYTRDYCEEQGLDYKTEAQMVKDWIHWFPSSGLVTKDQIKHIHFVFDSGYDVKAIQCAVNRIGSHFTMSIKTNRIVDGINVKEYFRRHRHLPWQTIRIKSGSGGKGSRRTYRTRHQARVKLKGCGLVTLICSEMKRKGNGQIVRKYLVSSDHSLSVREVIEIYKKRWAVESWHKEMKQNHGYRDARYARFGAIEAHVNLCLTAYNLVNEGISGLVRKGVTVREYMVASENEKSAQTINLFGGKARLKQQATAAMEKIKVA